MSDSRSNEDFIDDVTTSDTRGWRVLEALKKWTLEKAERGESVTPGSVLAMIELLEGTVE